jgi:aldehyde dehydrogenase (NAD+)
VEPLSKKVFSVFNPKDDSLVTDNKQPVCGAEDVDTARKAYRGPWSKFSGAERGDCLFKFASLLEKHAEEAAYYESICSGRIVSQLSYEVPWIARVIRY